MPADQPRPAGHHPSAHLSQWACRTEQIQVGGPPPPPVDWTAVTPDIYTAINTLPVVVHHGWSEHFALRHHLPGWAPTEVIAVRALARLHGKAIASHNLATAWQSTRPTCRLVCGPDLCWCQPDHAVLLHELLRHLTHDHTTWAHIRDIAVLPTHLHQTRPADTHPLTNDPTRPTPR